MRRCLGKEVRQVKRRKRKADENTIDTVSNVVEFCIPEPEQAFMMIMAGECGVFSPKLLRVFEKVRKEMEELI